MPDHVHLLLTPSARREDLAPLSACNSEIAEGNISKEHQQTLWDSSGPVWQEESFDHIPRTQEAFEAKLEYIRPKTPSAAA